MICLFSCQRTIDKSFDNWWYAYILLSCLDIKELLINLSKWTLQLLLEKRFIYLVVLHTSLKTILFNVKLFTGVSKLVWKLKITAQRMKWNFGKRGRHYIPCSFFEENQVYFNETLFYQTRIFFKNWYSEKMLNTSRLPCWL